MSKFARNALALLVLGALVAAAVELARDEEVAVHAPRPAANDTPPRPVTADLSSLLRRVRQSGEVIGEPFAGRAAPRPEVVAAVPPPPPPFPYRYAGQFRIDGGGWRVYLLKGNDLVLIKVGDVLDGAFKVTAIAAEDFEIEHLPSKESRVISYAYVGTDTAGTQGEGQTPLPSHASAAISGAPSQFVAPAGYSIPGSGATGVPAFGGSPTVARAGSASSDSVVGGSIPSGQLGSSGPAAGAPPLGDSPPASSSMPMDPAPAGIMQTLPAPTGRLGV